MKIKYLIKGILKSIPGVEHVYNFHKATGGTNDARYCYAVWMRHLILAWEKGNRAIPESIAELGPGDSLGIGLAALLSGARKYYALDVIRYSNKDRNLSVFNELVKLFRTKADIPTDSEFPNIRPALNSYSFPSHIISDERLAELLDEKRLELIRHSIIHCESVGKPSDEYIISYKVPWSDTGVIQEESVDMIISQAVLQHVDDLEHTYRSMNAWLKKGGIMSHNIDLKSMGASDLWYGHWTYTELEWKLVKGRKKYLINREPYSTHMRMTDENGFELLQEIKEINKMPEREELAPRYKEMSNTDISVCSLFIQAIKAKKLVMFHFAGIVISDFIPANLMLLT